MFRITTVVLLFLTMGALAPGAGADSRLLIKFKLDGRSVDGTPVLWNKSNAAVLGRDGRLWYFPTREATNLRKTTVPFSRYDTTRMRSVLKREFGGKFEVTAAGHYLVVHPCGAGRQWSRRFEELYRSFWMYFSVRGFPLTEPEFPLVAVVLRTKGEFYNYARRTRGKMPPGVLAYYSPTTNRVALYDVTGGRSPDAWYRNAGTIIHEATHQTAFNTGIHNRLGATPRWVAEGLGTLFEARGIWDQRHTGGAKGRINQGRFEAFRRYADSRPADTTARLVSSDRLFRSNAAVAYANAWALTYYLVETRPHKYSAYLARVAKRPKFRNYSSAQRLANFTSVFGENLRLLDAQFLRFMESVRY